MQERVEKPWGGYQVIGSGRGFQVKLISVEPGQRLSLQRHTQRSEQWTVALGVAEALIDDDVMEITVGGTAFVDVGASHRISNNGNETLVIVEVQFGEYLGEDDIERLEDDYGRV
jgi:mannose-6-phosphate isomerase-like protein (cupin superfamily)